MRTDPVLLEVLANRFRAIADEMADTIQRTAFSVFVKETGDYVAGLTTSQGETFAFPSSFPPMMIGDDARKAIEAFDVYDEGDIILTNDPFSTSGWMTHLNDLHMMKPVFVEGELLFFLWDFLHLSDVGGSTPGSIAASNSEVFQEGIRIPPVKLYRQGAIDRSVRAILEANTRTPDLNWGDISALVGALNQGERRVHEMVAKYGVTPVRQSMEDLLAYADQRARALIATIPAGTYNFTDYLEMQDGGDPVRISVSITVDGERVHLDFTGSSPQVTYAYNFLAGGKRHGEAIYGVANLLKAMDPSLPANAGLLRSVTAYMPEGSILNPLGHPALGVRMATLRRVMETVHGALAQAMPALMPAGSGDQTLIFISTGAADGTEDVSLLQPSLGGSGARATKDGIDGVDAISWLRNVPIEALEAELPLRVRRYHLDFAAGPGKYRGGRGSIFEVEADAPCRVIARNRNRKRFRPWGRSGGLPGGLSRVVLNPGTEDERVFETVGDIRLRKGDVIRFVSSSGGGFGDALERDPEDVLRDVQEKAVMPEDAHNTFGVILRDGVVDHGATTRLRSSRRVAPSTAQFSFGPERAEFDAGTAPRGDG